MKNSKRIHSVRLKRMYDESPDTSWLGEYADRPNSDFSIDRLHDKDCPLFWANDDCTDDDERECSCASVWDSREYRYFNPGSVEPFNASADWLKNATDKRTYWFDSMRSNAISDYERMESLHRGDFCFIGISAEAVYSIGGTSETGHRYHYPLQTVTSGGLWGIESDSDRAFLEETEQEQLSELKAELLAIGFSKRAIAAAFKNVERSGDIE